ncbi:MAG: CDP-diacylglycerol--glycerol-3-phosphate 3-phosphatidyltransferase [Candidatus Omnitrophica bacterium]|nr:CDP-diacylglycerol--glycerol-3-phosphate 3-phosphatidyltransferase [Candidatus Omnitrophota bacterium]
MNLPNKLTVLRIILTFVFMFFLFLSQDKTDLITTGIDKVNKPMIFGFLALLTFALAAITDFLDGYIARTRNIVTEFGKFMDPIADKILILCPFLAFVEMDIIPAWMVLIIFSREITITSLRLLAASQGRIVAATRAGKHKTVWQFIGIFVILTFLFAKGLYVRLFYFWDPDIEYWSHIIIYYLMIIIVFLTMASGAIIVWRNRFIFYEKK